MIHVRSFVALALVAALGAQESRPSSANSEVVVQAKSDALLGVAGTASEGAVRGGWVRERPLLRAAEVLESVPGLVVTQHSGSGKANQFFLRGFNLDHGTDFATRVEGMPVNMPTHVHGQGYTDLNFLIPELIDRVEFWKGPYHAELGDFSSAGAAHIQYLRSLEHKIAKIEAGSHGHARALLAGSQRFESADLLAAFEIGHDDGPWESEQDFDKKNLLLRWSEGDAARGWSLTGVGYSASWNSTDQVPRRAVSAGSLGRYGAVDPSDGGESSRYALSGEWHREDGESKTDVRGFAFGYDLDLFSNFTYFLADPVNGDQFEQKERRYALGGEVEHALVHRLIGCPSETKFGGSLRSDRIGNSLSSARLRSRLATTRMDDTWLTGFGLFASNETRWTPWLRTRTGLRGDAFLVDVESDSAANSGGRSDALVSPKLGVVLGPWHDTEFYVSAGLGFHSNDGRGALTRDDPTTPTPGDGQRVKPLVQTRGGELGLRTSPAFGLTASLALWLLELDSELVFVGDAGATEASRASRRHGLEFQTQWSPRDWLTGDCDVALSRAAFRDRDPVGRHIPGSVQGVVSGGVTVRPLKSAYGSLRARYFGPRPLVEDDSVRSRGSMLWNVRLGYTPSQHSEFTLDLLNLFDAKVSDIDYLYESRLPGEPDAGVSDVHTHPAEPFGIRLALRISF